MIRVSLAVWVVLMACDSGRGGKSTEFHEKRPRAGESSDPKTPEPAAPKKENAPAEPKAVAPAAAKAPEADEGDLKALPQVKVTAKAPADATEDPLERQLPFLAGEPHEPTGGLGEEGLKGLLLRDPDRALEQLNDLKNSSDFYGRLWAQLSPPVGQKIVDEGKLFEPVIEAPFEGDGGTAYVGVAELAFTSPKSRPLQLPINTELTVMSVKGDVAQVSVSIPSAIEVDGDSLQVRVLAAQPLVGQVNRDGLSSVKTQVSSLQSRLSRLESTQSDREAAIQLNHRLALIVGNERARRAWLEAAFSAQRADEVARIAKGAMTLAARGFTFASHCSAEAGPQTQFIPLARVAPAAHADQSVCLTGREPVEPCPANEKAQPAWQQLQKSLSGYRPVHQFQITVDAHAGGSLWFFAAPVHRREGCDTNEAYEIDIRSARVRQIAIPLGAESMKVFLQTPVVESIEYGVAATQGPGKAERWLRQRARVNWLVSSRGTVEPSLGTGDVGYSEVKGVTATLMAIPARRPCECDAL